MMTPQVYKALIVSGIQDLLPTLLAEVANFVYFVRKQVEDPDAFAAEQYKLLLGKALSELDAHEGKHVEAEFGDYEKQAPVVGSATTVIPVIY